LLSVRNFMLPISLSASFTEIFGFPMPKTVVDFIGQTIEISERENYAEKLSSSDAPGIIFAHYCFYSVQRFQCRDYAIGETGRYSSTPFEIFPILRYGGDGIHWGPMVHAPELELEDYAWAEHNPCEYSSYLLGSNSSDAIEQILSDNLGRLASSDEDPLNEAGFIREISTMLSLAPSASKARDLSQWVFPLVVPLVPTGWHYVATSDGVGVLAAASAFCSEVPECWGSGSLDECMERVQSYLRQGYPATALGIIREFHRKAMPGLEDLAPQWMEIYTQLNRPLLAREVDRELQKERERQRTYDYGGYEEIEERLVLYLGDGDEDEVGDD
jgi:hypothetical protein